MKGKKEKNGKPSSERKAPSISPETKSRILKFTGLVVAAFTIFSLVSICSYFFTWKADQSLAFGSGAAQNLGASLGSRWGRFLVADCFGIGSIVLVVWLGLLSFRLFFRNRSFGFLRASVLTISLALLSSMVCAYASILFSANTAFGKGLGGGCGFVTADFLCRYVGAIVTGAILFLLAVLWLLFASARFSAWFASVGEKKEVADEKKEDLEPKNDDEDQGGDESSDEEKQDGDESSDQEQDDETADEGGDNEDGGDSSDDQEEGGEGETRTDEGEQEEKDDSEETGGETGDSENEDNTDDANDDGTDGDDDQTGEGGSEGDSGEGDMENSEDGDSTFTVDKPEDITNEVTEELPRYDNREELVNYRFPSLDLLRGYEEDIHEVSEDELQANNLVLRETLATYGIKVDNVVALPGPTVTLYKVNLAPGMKIAQIRSREEDIAMALGSKGVRVVTLPDAVGIEVPNAQASTVSIKSLLNNPAFRESKAELPVAIGCAVLNKVKIFDLAKAPQLLVAGATGQGKSVGLNVIIASLLYSKHPSELKLVFIDPKRVEFSAYSSLLKHYLAVLPTAASEDEEMNSAIVKDAKASEAVLRSLCIEMDERYTLMETGKTNKITLYNEKFKKRHLNPNDGHRYLPYIVVVIDEYADLLMAAGGSAESKAASRSIETSIARLAQKGRAAGIHVIIATQRPSVNVITGLIKANFPMRIAFRTQSRIDSMTILDQPGAERLIGRGDMLYYAGVEMERLQCANISMDEIEKITEFIGSETKYKECYNTPYYLPDPGTDEGDQADSEMIDMSRIDKLFEDAARRVVLTQKGSTTQLQRDLGVGFARAGKIMDQLEAAGIVGPQVGSKPREILIKDMNELEPILNAYLK